MRVHLIKKPTVLDFMAANATSRLPLTLWMLTLKTADWNTAEDIKSTFGSADLLGNGSDRVIFNIGGNNYRMICKYQFFSREVRLFIKWIGTHAAYDKLCASGEQYTVNDY